jgi:succinate-semialdehyde dehydrogenase/glutarate-semialdehyde dehydrogenase
MSAILHENLRRQSLVKTSGLVAGVWRQAKDKKAFPVFEPATGTILCHCADLGQQDFLDAIESATVGTSEFAEYTAKARSGILSRWYDLVTEHTEDCK